MAKGGGGKGGQQQQTSTTALPPEILAVAKQNMGMADEASKIGFVPYQGNTVAALTPMQQAAMQNTQGALGNFNMKTGAEQAKASGVDPYTGLAMSPTLQGGVLGYSPMAQYQAAKDKIAPVQRGLIDSFTVNPDTGAAPASPLVTPTALYGIGTPSAPAQAAAAAAPATTKRTLTRQEQDRDAIARYRADRNRR